MEIVDDIKTLMPSIREEIMTGFEHALGDREEDICVLTIGNVVSTDSIAYNFLYTLVIRDS
jgi:hypothetical protein